MITRLLAIRDRYRAYQATIDRASTNLNFLRRGNSLTRWQRLRGAARAFQRGGSNDVFGQFTQRFIDSAENERILTEQDEVPVGSFQQQADGYLPTTKKLPHKLSNTRVQGVDLTNVVAALDKKVVMSFNSLIDSVNSIQRDTSHKFHRQTGSIHKLSDEVKAVLIKQRQIHDELNQLNYERHNIDGTRQRQGPDDVPTNQPGGGGTGILGWLAQGVGFGVAGAAGNALLRRFGLGGATRMGASVGARVGALGSRLAPFMRSPLTAGLGLGALGAYGLYSYFRSSSEEANLASGQEMSPNMNVQNLTVTAKEDIIFTAERDMKFKAARMTLDADRLELDFRQIEFSPGAGLALRNLLRIWGGLEQPERDTGRTREPFTIDPNTGMFRIPPLPGEETPDVTGRRPPPTLGGGGTGTGTGTGTGGTGSGAGPRPRPPPISPGLDNFMTNMGIDRESVFRDAGLTPPPDTSAGTGTGTGTGSGGTGSGAGPRVVPHAENITNRRMALGQQIYQYFLDRGLSREQAAAIAGNMVHEGGGRTNLVYSGRDGLGDNPYNSPNSPHSAGIAQWNDRLPALRRFAIEQGIDVPDGDLRDRTYVQRMIDAIPLQTQLDFAWHEMNTTEGRAFRMIQGATDLESANRGAISYHRPAGWTWRNPSGGMHFRDRLGLARDILAQGPAPTSGVGAGGDRLVDSGVEGISLDQNNRRRPTPRTPYSGSSGDAFTRAITGNGNPGSVAVDLALQQRGLTSRSDRAALIEYLQNGGQNLDPATTAWCAAFVNSSLQQAGIPGLTGSGRFIANSFQRWGERVEDPNTVQRGDVLVESRGRGAGQTGGHVGLATGRTRINARGELEIEMISGNAGGGAVRTTWRRSSSLIIRRDPNAAEDRSAERAAEREAARETELRNQYEQETGNRAQIDGQNTREFSDWRRTRLDQSVPGSIIDYPEGDRGPTDRTSVLPGLDEATGGGMFIPREIVDPNALIFHSTPLGPPQDPTPPPQVLGRNMTVDDFDMYEEERSWLPDTRHDPEAESSSVTSGQGNDNRGNILEQE